MGVSLPSREVYSVSVPQAQEFSAVFRYNFFTPDERGNDTAGVPLSILSRTAATIGTDYIQFATTRAPRMVVFTWTPPRLTSVGDVVSDLDIRNNSLKTNTQNNSLISDNIASIVTEDHFASNNFVSTTFHDGSIDDKVYDFVSGSFLSHTLGKPVDTNVGQTKAAIALQSSVPSQVNQRFLARAMTNPARSAGALFSTPGGMPKTDAYFDGLKSVATHAQVNSKLFQDMTGRNISDPNSQFSGDLVNLQAFAGKVDVVAQQKASDVSDADYKAFVPYIDLTVRNTMTHADGRGAQIVGFIIDKTESLADGSVKNHPPVIVENAHVSTTADFAVRYDATYTYSIRTIALFNLSAIDDDTGDVGMIKVLISSKPSNKMTVHAVDDAAPPPPTDVNMRWDYEADKLVLTWTFPPNSQRDVKKFQVFKRDNVGSPFELQKEYDFDDSVQPFPDNEDPDPRLVEVINNPVAFWIDDDFDRTKMTREEQAPIYAVACIDAHGLTSAYSIQFKVWFDPFKNKLQKKLVSHAGAPKPYPNLYLEANPFTDTIRVSGAGSKRLKLYFNPEFYHLVDDSDRFVKVLSTKQDGGSYVFNFVNLDNQAGQAVNVVIDDQTNVATSPLASPTVSVGSTKANRIRSNVGD